MALNTQWGCGLTLEALAQLGLTLGADIPVFVYGLAAFAEGVGERLTPVAPEEKWYLVVVPPVSVPTSRIFSDPELCRDTHARSFSSLMTTPFQNNCEPITRKHFPAVEQHIAWLLEYAPSRMTGTGACVFAEFDTEIEARNILSKTPEWMHGFVAQGVNISPLQRELSKVKQAVS